MALCQARTSTKPLWGLSSSNPYHPSHVPNIHSWLVFSIQLVNCCPHGGRNNTCVLFPLYLTFSLTSLPPSQTKLTVHTDSMCDWGGEGWGDVELSCRPYSAGVLRSVSDQIQNLPNCSTTPNKMTSEDHTLRDWCL